MYLTWWPYCFRKRQLYTITVEIHMFFKAQKLKMGLDLHLFQIIPCTWRQKRNIIDEKELRLHTSMTSSLQIRLQQQLLFITWAGGHVSQRYIVIRWYLASVHTTCTIVRQYSDTIEYIYFFNVFCTQEITVFMNTFHSIH